MEKVIIVSRDLKHKGGVVYFIDLLLKNISRKNFEYIHYVQGKPTNRYLNILLPFLLVLQLLEFLFALRKYSPEIVHFNPSLKIRSLIRDAFYVFASRLFSRKTRIIAMFHGWDDELAQKIITNRVYRGLFKSFYGSADLVIALCEQYRHRLIQMDVSRRKIKVITTMYENYDITEKRRNSENELIKILFMARFVEAKGIYIVGEVGKLLVENGYRNFKLIFAGDGPEYEGIKKFVSVNKLFNFIDFPGYVTGNLKRDILINSDVFLFPTFYGEGCPVVVLEAMGAGLAVISRPVAAIPELVENNINGFVVDSKDPEDFYLAILKLISNKESLLRIQKTNIKKARENYEVAVVTQKIESVYLSLLNK